MFAIVSLFACDDEGYVCENPQMWAARDGCNDCANCGPGTPAEMSLGACALHFTAQGEACHLEYIFEVERVTCELFMWDAPASEPELAACVWIDGAPQLPEGRSVCAYWRPATELDDCDSHLQNLVIGILGDVPEGARAQIYCQGRRPSHEDWCSAGPDGAL